MLLGNGSMIRRYECGKIAVLRFPRILLEISVIEYLTLMFYV